MCFISKALDEDSLALFFSGFLLYFSLSDGWACVMKG